MRLYRLLTRTIKLEGYTIRYGNLFLTSVYFISAVYEVLRRWAWWLVAATLRRK
ncbi:hypothetical protein PHYBLDRAFT_159505 [Phycomyces blakesleeanus NRRL 1555(-)]|uniref:EXS domain-containing protein n=1 Tax=Phycomyces blakesleeanus (strain ATCC 8743b / DSM 1359 / FGSC 10004 / NBRC 33097 / NRRL 1555) TaxID=763407 RepID=A0A167LRH2_PHYB8|nr:hypothetical protein PHYBLDRAFT_159505 [Phycomyces blakesleeanus NRRL 1555(-)]OAD70946.1 hypothetical protein PHYBLDRAFT_159505 [Phycomyces blakesleeanus NRRL 1555(-)]|eukprot:XP_018288986.1 hypothetical protein PHYBLDRAFT_159505 [Phycomyces blakesleeanus NRRL 1555(-)]